jgi:hypothetical protein
MTTFEAIAGVSATLRNLLRSRMSSPVQITIAPPDVTVTGITGERANLYLYQLSENTFLKNQQIPGEGHPSSFGRPPLSLDLSYLVTAYGTSPDSPDADLQAQQVLGDVMQVFHDFPIITKTLHETDDPGDPLILDPSLVGSFERLKITLQTTNLDDVTKIWSALPDSAFRRSVTYHVSAVQIESSRPRQAALPVKQRVVRAFPFRSPHIERLTRAGDSNFVSRPPGVEVGETLVVSGRNLGARGTRVRIGTALVEPARVEDRTLDVVVPASLSAGSHLVQVLQPPARPESGAPLGPGVEFESNAVPVLLLPRVDAVVPPAASAGALVTISVTPSVTAAQRRSLLLNDREILGELPAPDAAPSASVAFRLPTGTSALSPGPRLLRLRIDGVDSRLTTDPVNERYNGPNFMVNP